MSKVVDVGSMSTTTKINTKIRSLKSWRILPFLRMLGQ
jgi:hypothetical protein